MEAEQSLKKYIPRMDILINGIQTDLINEINAKKLCDLNIMTNLELFSVDFY